jgi:hypothetical protein
LKSFSPTDIYQFLQQWNFDRTTKDQNVVRIYTALTDQPTLREMCANPLVLSMYVARDQAAGHPLAPESRSDFYLSVTEELLIKRRAVQVGAAEGQTVLRQQRQKILGMIAFEHLINADEPTNLLSWKNGISAVQKIMGYNQTAAEAHLRLISKDTGLITEEREGEAFRFIHLTFCEFLTAFEAAQGRADGWSQLMACHQKFNRPGAPAALRSRLLEVLPFAAALLPMHMRPAAIANLAASVDQRALALAFLETKLYDHPVWPGFISGRADALLNSADKARDSEWLREVHLFMVLCGDAERAATLLPRINSGISLDQFFSVLAGQDDDTVFRLIQTYAEQDAVAAFRVASLCKIDLVEKLPNVAIENADQPAFQAILLERASRERDNLRWAFIFGEAGLRSPAAAYTLSQSTNPIWKEKVETLPRRFRWFLEHVVPRSLFTECLSLSYSSPNLSENLFPLLHCLRSMTPPGRRRIEVCLHLALGFCSYLVSVFYFIFILIFISGVINHGILGFYGDNIHTLLALSGVLALLLLSLNIIGPFVLARERIYYRFLYLFPEYFNLSLFHPYRMLETVALLYHPRSSFYWEASPIGFVQRVAIGGHEFKQVTRMISLQQNSHVPQAAA